MDTKEIQELEDVSVLDLGGDDTPSSVYEVGYHLLPTLSEEEVPGAVEKIMAAIKAEGATFVGDRAPVKIELAYGISKHIDTKNVFFDSAYFGWVAFEVSRDAIEKIKAFLDAQSNVLRHIILRTDRGAVEAVLSGAVVTPMGDIGKPKREVEVGGEVSDAALNDALQTIATEDAPKEEKA